jgi:hypothetical protein
VLQILSAYAQAAAEPKCRGHYALYLVFKYNQSEKVVIRLLSAFPQVGTRQKIIKLGFHCHQQLDAIKQKDRINYD